RGDIATRVHVVNRVVGLLCAAVSNGIYYRLQVTAGVINMLDTVGIKICACTGRIENLERATVLVVGEFFIVAAGNIVNAGHSGCGGGDAPESIVGIRLLILRASVHARA